MSHSVFVHEGGAVVRKCGVELRTGDRLIAPRRIRLTSEVPERIDLVRVLHADPDAAAMVWLRGPAVARGFADRLAGADLTHPPPRPADQPRVGAAKARPALE